MKTFWKTLNIFLMSGILAVGLLLLGTMMPIPGNYKVKIVKSGSMEPAIKTGGIVVIKPESAYAVGDVVTFGADTKTQIPTTHRIIEMGDGTLGTSIRTKGDANNAPDPRPTPLSEVSGKVVFTLPYVGFLLDFARKPIGFALLVGLPAFAVIVDELGKIIAEVKRLRRKNDNEPPHGDTDAGHGKEPLMLREVVKKDEPRLPVGLTPWPKNEMSYAVFLEKKSVSSAPQHHTKKTHAFSLSIFSAVLFPVIILGALSSVGSTVSYFSDVESSTGNYLKADPLGFSVTLPSSSVDMSSRAQFVVPVFTPNEDSEPIQYSISAYMTGGDTTLCGLLHIEATSTFSYSGALLLLATPMLTTTGEIPFYFSIPDDYSANENSSCFVDLIFAGRNQGAEAGAGYHYSVHLPVQFYVPQPPVIPAALPASLPFEFFTPNRIEEPAVVIPQNESTTTESIQAEIAAPADTFVPPQETPPIEQTLPIKEESAPLPENIVPDLVS